MTKICSINLGPRQIQRRFRLGLIGSLLSIVVLLALLALDAPRLWRWILLLPLMITFLGFFQAREKT